MALINKKSIKEELKKENIKIGNQILGLLIENQEKEIRQNIEIISRNAKLSGRKTIQKEDISELTK